ncbi:tRNA (adenine57-N1/adenine58-N1)-methyltransferase [Capronia coronata CBS 617.96]|uniref:tRNA (adenine(58)-N(1))-methyltransferase catalytic subunit TRM61 n=1 Tax=Capronia coronata CBS 617.96 TaxID=1182541 RepID=W9XJ21_9EURO|nr:tRNA (adenine57-N1/adenine58-N1)-methyltransferase [Capronia coronata CBS 617.96]EXJ80512.1 tRNA (adenine57-N1/adenine58-N1)-methyltransferase [Capronia coronata CBS 617.96]
MVSPFLSPGLVSKEHDLASLHLRRDQSLPVVLSTEVTSAEHVGYAEGVVTNTRFGSFPHTTMIGVPWGSQIRASKVDTGSRGRKEAINAKKRKAEVLEQSQTNSQNGESVVAVEAASSGFVHLLPPTPENWTISLPHRTQVVYTPDYAYILHRIRARPGSRLIEAGSGSGSFTHAAARAVFNGYPTASDSGSEQQGTAAGDVESLGKVFSYEFHAERHKKVKAEMVEHGLDGVVHTMHRDVYADGLLVYKDESEEKTSPEANAIFLDLPAPWEALPHLTRDRRDGTPSALDPNSAVHICTFSPCIEQVQKTVSALRQHDWLDIEMVEVQHKRIEVRREYTGLAYEGMRGVNPYAVDVEEALAKLREVERRARDFHAGSLADRKPANGGQQHGGGKLPFDGGKLVHRTEPEIKTHTSYLVFAVLPRAWSEEDEAAAQAKWSKHVTVASNVPKSQRQLKKEAKLRAKNQRQAQNGVDNGNEAKEAIEEVMEEAAGSTKE